MPAYARLLLNALEEDPTLSIRADEEEESWRIVGPLLRAWEENRVPLLEYPAGSEGPNPDVLRPHACSPRGVPVGFRASVQTLMFGTRGSYARGA